MANLDTVIENLRILFSDEAHARERLSKLKERPLDFQFDFQGEYEQAVSTARANIERYLKRRTLRYPYYHEGHFAKLKPFHEEAPYEASVFIMTKYVEKEDAEDEDGKRLASVIEIVAQSVRDQKLTPRLASEKTYHELLWQNVELYTLGSCRGIAIVEDRYRPELNPNVAMEWGWMRAMDKPVLFLMEKDFKHRRADWEGLMPESFSWDNPAETIPPIVEKYFKKTAIDI